MFKKIILAALFAFVAMPASAGTILWSPVTGDINFPGLTTTTIDNTPIGVTTPAAGNFTTVGATNPADTTVAKIHIDSGTKTATAVAGAATLNKQSGKITSEALTTAGLADYTLTLTDSGIAAADIVLCSVANGTNTQGTVGMGPVVAGAGSATILVHNLHATQALNGTIVVSFAVLKN